MQSEDIIIFRYRCSNVLYLHDSRAIYPQLADALETESDACVEDDAQDRGFARSKQVPSIAGHCIHNAYDHDHHHHKNSHNSYPSASKTQGGIF